MRLLDVLCDRGRAALDVGANKGLYTYFCRRHASHVYAVEAHPVLAKQLERSFGKGVTVLNLALSNAPGTANIYVPVMGGREVDTRGSLESSAADGAEVNSIEVSCKTIDELNLQNVGFMKIDVEGHELSVLEGAREFLQRERPNVLVEVEERHRAGAIAGVFGLLAQAGYEGYFLEGNELRSVSEFSLDVHQNAAHVKPVFGARTGMYINNFVFLPRDSAPLVARLRARVAGL